MTDRASTLHVTSSIVTGKYFMQFFLQKLRKRAAKLELYLSSSFIAIVEAVKRFSLLEQNLTEALSTCVYTYYVFNETFRSALRSECFCETKSKAYTFLLLITQSSYNFERFVFLGRTLNGGTLN